jgi:hypothetical protein
MDPFAASVGIVSASLQRLFHHSVRTKLSYFILYPPASETRGKIQAFQEWLLEQASGRQRPG